MEKPLTIAIDYDDTFTKAPDMWGKLIKYMGLYGHNVICVTARGNDHLQEVLVALHGIIKQEKIYATGGGFKRPFMQKKGIQVDIWIDDMPEMISDTAIL